MALPEEGTILDNGVVLEGGLLCVSHIPLQVTDALNHNAKHPFFQLPAELMDEILSYLPQNTFRNLTQVQHRIKLSENYFVEEPNTLRMRPYTIRKQGGLKPHGTLAPTALQQTCRALYAGYVNVLLSTLQNSIIFINSAENHHALASHMSLYPAHAQAVRSIEITYNPQPRWWQTYDSPFFTHVFPNLQNIYLHVVEWRQSWDDNCPTTYDVFGGKMLLRKLRNIEGDAVSIRVTFRSRFEAPREQVEKWMEEELPLDGPARKTKRDWTRQEWDSYWWGREAAQLARDRRRRAAAAESGTN